MSTEKIRVLYPAGYTKTDKTELDEGAVIYSLGGKELLPNAHRRSNGALAACYWELPPGKYFLLVQKIRNGVHHCYSAYLIVHPNGIVDEEKTKEIPEFVHRFPCVCFKKH